MVFPVSKVQEDTLAYNNRNGLNLFGFFCIKRTTGTFNRGSVGINVCPATTPAAVSEAGDHRINKLSGDLS
jgi:hypothetical protein